ncbi:MAG: hypothetical protein RL757_395, partial [Bacteroidota bacterium]
MSCSICFFFLSIFSIFIEKKLPPSISPPP